MSESPVGCVDSDPRKNMLHLAGEAINQSAIARCTGLHQSYISRVFRGERMPSIPAAKRIAAAMGVSLEGLLDMVEQRMAEEAEKAKALKATQDSRIAHEIEEGVSRIKAGLPVLPSPPIENSVRIRRKRA